MTSLPRADADRDYVIAGRLWNRLAAAVERADRLAVGGGLEMIELQGGRVLSLRQGPIQGRGVMVQITGAPLSVGGSGSTVTISGSGKYSGVILADRTGDVDYSADIVFSELGNSSVSGGAAPCLIVNLAEWIMLDVYAYSPSRWLDYFGEALVVPGVRGAPNSDGTPVVYVWCVPFVPALPTGCTGSGS